MSRAVKKAGNPIVREKTTLYELLKKNRHRASHVPAPDVYSPSQKLLYNGLKTFLK